MASTFEYRGVSDLVYAEVIFDTNKRYYTGPIRPLSPVATVARETANNSKTSYYDNQPMVVITSTGADTIQLTIAPPELSILSDITGQRFKGDSGSMIECEKVDRDFALGYKYQGTDGRTRYSWRYKGKFSIPNETYNTKDDGTDTGNVTITYTGVSTTYKFSADGVGAKGIVVDDSLGKLDYDRFLTKVWTPDSIQSLIVGESGVPAPVFAPANPIFSGTLTVALVSPSASASIKYTTDGSDPTTSSTAKTYSASEMIQINKTTTIKAYAYAGGSPVEPSEVVSKTYIKQEDI
jgi:phi13 family phage major tail protein